MTVSGVSSALERLDVEHVLLVEAEARQAADLPQVALLHGAGVERVEIVDPDHLVASARQRLDQMRADEARRAGDEDPGHRALRPIPWYSKPSAVIRAGS